MPRAGKDHKPNSVTRTSRAVIIHLGRLLPDGSCDLPENASRIAPGTRTSSPVSFPYLVLHLEEFAWPRMSPHAPVSSYPTISPITFRLDCFLLHLSSPAEAGARPLAGSMLYGVRTFLSRSFRERLPVPFSYGACLTIAKAVEQQQLGFSLLSPVQLLPAGIAFP